MEKNQFSIDWISLIVPVSFVLCGLAVVILALIGSPKIYEESKNLQMQAQIEKLGKTKARILHAVVGAGMTAFGGWLLYCAVFGPIQK